MFEDFETRRIATGGAEIHLRLGGAGPPLLLLHGYPQSHVMWHRIAPALARRLDDRQATARAAAAGITVSPLSTYFQGPATSQGLLIGYAAVPEAEIEAGVKTLATALRS